MTVINKDILQIAIKQSALDLNCGVSDFLCDHNVIIVASDINKNAKKYYKEPIPCNLISYGSNIVAFVQSKCKKIVQKCLESFEFYHCFETLNMHWLNEQFSVAGKKYVL